MITPVNGAGRGGGISAISALAIGVRFNVTKPRHSPLMLKNRERFRTEKPRDTVAVTFDRD